MKSLVILFSFLASTYAVAEESPFKTMRPNEVACFGREYGTQHLKAHPYQTVQKIQAKLYKSANNIPVMSLELTLKGDKEAFKNYRAYFVCPQDESFCYIECDGGRAKLTREKNGNISVRNYGFIIEGSCGDNDGEGELKKLENKLKGDDRFELVPLPKEFCQNTEDYF